jgi:hypothetical protein
MGATSPDRLNTDEPESVASGYDRLKVILLWSMAIVNESRTLTIELSDSDWQLLETEALKVNQSKEIVVLHILQERLHPKPIQESLDALWRLSAIGDRQVPFDAEQLIREGREELAQRSIF